MFLYQEPAFNFPDACLPRTSESQRKIVRADANTRLVDQLGTVLADCVDAVLARADAPSEAVKVELLKRLYALYKQRALFGTLAQPLLRKVVHQLFDETAADVVAYTDALLMPLAPMVLPATTQSTGGKITGVGFFRLA
jgi:hypothetical protein